MAGADDNGDHGRGGITDRIRNIGCGSMVSGAVDIAYQAE